MHTVTTIGLDIAKSVFQVHCVDVTGHVVIRRQLKRRYVLAFFEKLPPCLVGIEACASSHHWSRELQALGHHVRLMPPAYVKPYVKRQKNDMADAEAICEAVTRANMRFVPTKTPEQQSGLVGDIQTPGAFTVDRSKLAFACFGRCDLSNPICSVLPIHFVTILRGMRLPALHTTAILLACNC